MVMGSWLGKRRNQRSEPYCMEHTAHHHRLSMVEAFCLLDRIREREAREFCPQKAAGNEERDCLFELFSLSVLLVPRYILFRAAEIKRLSWETAYTHNIHAVDCYYNTTSKDQQQKSLSEQSKLSSSPSCWVMREKKRRIQMRILVFSLCLHKRSCRVQPLILSKIIKKILRWWLCVLSIRLSCTLGVTPA